MDNASGSGRNRLEQVLDRMLAVNGWRELRDLLIAEPTLLSEEVDELLGGRGLDAEKLAMWRRTLRRFREHGAFDGYLIMAAALLGSASTPEERMAVFVEHRDLLTDHAVAFFTEQADRASAANDDDQARYYREIAEAINRPLTNGMPEWLERRDRMQSALGRLMDSDDLRAARDEIAQEPLLLGTEVDNYLQESLRRLRQLGEVDMARRVEHWHSLLARFRDDGVEDAYLGILVEDFGHAMTVVEATNEFLEDNPEVLEPATREYLERRAAEDEGAGRIDEAHRWRMTAQILESLASGGKILSVDAVGLTFEEGRLAHVHESEGMVPAIEAFIADPSATERRRILESNPDLLTDLGSRSALAWFDQRLQSAQQRHDVVETIAIGRARRLFADAVEVGPERAFADTDAGS